MSSFLSMGTYVLSLIATSILGLFYYQKKRSKKLNAHMQQETLRAKLEIQEQTHKSVSHEIHDNIGQLLSLAKLNLNRIEFQSLAGDEQKLLEAKDLISQSIKDLRNLSKTLQAENIRNIGFIKAIANEIALVQKANVKRVNLKVEGTVERLDADKEIILYRLFQEVLHAIINYTEDAFIEIEVSFKEDGFVLCFSSKAIGLYNAMKKHLRSGLSNPKYRVKLIGAHLQLSSTPETGTSIHIYLPITN